MTEINSLRAFAILGGPSSTLGRRQLVIANAAAGLTALITGGVIVPNQHIASNSSRRLIGVRGMASDAIHLDVGTREALVKYTKQEIAKVATHQNA